MHLLLLYFDEATEVSPAVPFVFRDTEDVAIRLWAPGQPINQPDLMQVRLIWLGAIWVIFELAVRPWCLMWSWRIMPRSCYTFWLADERMSASSNTAWVNGGYPMSQNISVHIQHVHTFHLIPPSPLLVSLWQTNQLEGQPRKVSARVFVSHQQVGIWSVHFGSRDYGIGTCSSRTDTRAFRAKSGELIVDVLEKR